MAFKSAFITLLDFLKHAKVKADIITPKNIFDFKEQYDNIFEKIN